MRRRAKNEPVEPFQRREVEAEAEGLRKRLEKWAESVQPSWPEMPPGVADRQADVWEPLLAIAQACGEDWHERANEAAISLLAASVDDEHTLGVLLLRDLRAVFADAERLDTATVLERLHELEESPWRDIRGKPLDTRRLAKMLRLYGVMQKQVRVTLVTDVTLFSGKGEVTQKRFDVDKDEREKTQQKQLRGYERSDLEDPWNRYLPPLS